MVSRRLRRNVLLCLFLAIPVMVVVRRIQSQPHLYVTKTAAATPYSHKPINITLNSVFTPLIHHAGTASTWHLERKSSSTFQLNSWTHRGLEYLRCNVHTVGCFIPSLEEDSHSWIYYRPSPSIKNFTDWQCMETCSQRSKRKYEMIGIRPGGQCICAHYLNYTSLIGDDCSVPCSENQSFICERGKDRMTMVYQLTDQCSSVSTLKIEDVAIGCFQKSQFRKESWEHYVSDGDLSKESCIITCERTGFPLAIPFNYRSCYCGLMTHELSASMDDIQCSESRDDHVSVFKTFAEDRRCRKKRFLDPKDLRKRVGLISFPGSGNTWTRHLIESATGIYTGSAYNSDWGLLSGGFMGELLPAASSKVSVIKSHSASMHGCVDIDAAINIYRNPYDAMLAEFKRLTGGHVGNLNEDQFDRTAFKTFVTTKMAAGWYHLTRASAQKKIPRLIIPFEEMVKNPVHYAEKMARFILDNNVNEDELKERLLCLKYSSTGDFKRPKKNLSFDPYDDEMKTFVNSKIDLLAKVLETEGFGSIPDYRRKPSQ